MNQKRGREKKMISKVFHKIFENKNLIEVNNRVFDESKWVACFAFVIHFHYKLRRTVVYISIDACVRVQSMVTSCLVSFGAYTISILLFAPKTTHTNSVIVDVSLYI